QPLRPDSRDDDPAIFRTAFPRHQVPGFQAIEQPGDIGVVIYHAVANVRACGAIWSRAPQNPQHVVLSRREFEIAQERRRRLADDFGGPRDVENRYLLEQCKWPGLL